MQTMTPREALEAIGREAPGTREQGALAFALRQRVEKDADFAEGLVEEGGLLTILDVMSTAGGIMGSFLEAVCGLLLYETGLEQLQIQPDIVERIWRLTLESDSNGQPNLRVTRPAVQILIITIKFLGKSSDDSASWVTEEAQAPEAPMTGRKIVHRAAKRLEKEGVKVYEGLMRLMASTEINLQNNVMGLLVIMMQKCLEESRYKAKKLLFRWHQCGLLQKVEGVTSVDATLARLVKTFASLRDRTPIPQCWIAATREHHNFEREKQAYDQVNSRVFIQQQNLGRLRDARATISKAQATARSLSLQYGLSANYHPTKRFSEGGGIELPRPGKPLETASVRTEKEMTHADELKSIRASVFENYKVASDFREQVERITGPLDLPEAPKQGKADGRKVGGADEDSDTDTDSESDSDDLPPPSESDSDSDTDSSEEDFPSDSDEGEEGTGAPAPGTTPQGAGRGGTRHVDPVTGQPVAASSGDGVPSTSGDAGGGGGAAGPSGVGGGAGGSGGASGGGGGSGGGAAPGPSPTAGGGGAVPPKAPAPPGGAPPPPGAPAPPGAGGAKKRPPPPPGKGKGKGKGGAGPKVQWWKRGKPAKPLRVFHWDKVQVADEKAEGTMWNTVHFKLDCTFSLDDFTDKFQAKTKEPKGAKKGPVKAPKVEMMDGKKFQNLSIMLHKMPVSEKIKDYVDQLKLDADFFNRDHLQALAQNIPNKEEEEMFQGKIDEKNASGDEWEAPEKFFLMIYKYDSTIFKKRTESWLFTLDWAELTANVQKPLHKLRDAVSAVLNSDSMVFVMGILLGFGNMMNQGTAKGNAGAFGPKTLTQLEAARDKSGKVNLLQHLVHCVKKQREECLTLPEEMKPVLKGVHLIKYEDLDKAFQDAQGSLKKFQTQSKQVMQYLEKNGKADDPYIKQMDDFRGGAETQLDALEAEVGKLKDDFISVLRKWSSPKKVIEKPQPEEFFTALVPFLEKFQAEADIINKDQKKKKAHQGKKIAGNKGADKNIDDVVGSITEGIVSS